MSNAEHLIENAIFAIKEGRDLDDELDHWPNDEMLRQTGIKKDDIIRMAAHIVYSLYGGRFPGKWVISDTEITSNSCASQDDKPYDIVYKQ